MKEEFRFLKQIFTKIRLVDVNSNTAYCINDDGSIAAEECRCFEIWCKEKRCENCISAKAYGIKGQLEKFEFVGDDVYYVISRYIEYEGKPFMLEMVSKVSSANFVESIDRKVFAKQIQDYDRKLYIDPLTGAYNRLYYEEQLQHLDNISAVAMFDLDRFKAVNDNYGHQCGDEVLRCVAASIMKSIRSTDALIRYGGDEFLIVFVDIPEQVFIDKLERMRASIEALEMEKYPEVKISISLGGIISKVCDEAAVKRLDENLYKAKINRNCVVVE